MQQNSNYEARAVRVVWVWAATRLGLETYKGEMFLQNPWNVMSDVLLPLECTPRVAWAVLFEQRIHQAWHPCCVKFKGHSPVFVNMLPQRTCVAVTSEISCLNFLCKVYSILFIQKPCMMQGNLQMHCSHWAARLGRNLKQNSVQCIQCSNFGAFGAGQLP